MIKNFQGVVITSQEILTCKFCNSVNSLFINTEFHGGFTEIFLLVNSVIL
jgi:hypothetical protein